MLLEIRIPRLHTYQKPTILITPENFIFTYCSIVQPFLYFEVKASSDEVLEILTFIICENSKALQPTSAILRSGKLHFNLQLSTLISAEMLEKEAQKSHSHGTCYTMTFFFSLVLPVF